ncbi:sugar ABC transporter permease [Oscillospiraceae bacterium MB08-C2-2]|nr:sugar ABC transporter permease [Oscillospiraceae bacterium MB08-C2-2]
MRRPSGGTNPWFLLPSLMGVTLFVLVPFGDVLRRSFASAMGGQAVGFANYTAVFANKAFRLAAANTGRFLGVCIPILLALSLVVALCLYALGERAALFKTSLLIPMAVPVASVVLLWQVLFDGQGLTNGWLTGAGGSAVSWMDSPMAFWVLVGSYIWKNLGYCVVLWLAGLAGISPSLYEAARVDGAGNVQMFFWITLPNLLPTLYTLLVLSLINAFKVFREAYLIGGDYPHTSIYQLQHLFNNWFRELSMDKLSAAAVVVALVILGLIMLLRRAWDKED